MWLSLAKAWAVGKQRMRVMEIACPLGAKATGVETERTPPSQYNSKRCFTEAIVLHIYMHGFTGLVRGSVTSSRVPHQQLAFTALCGFMKYSIS